MLQPNLSAVTAGQFPPPTLIPFPQGVAEISFSWVGLGLALLFTISLSLIMWWMLHPPAQVTAAVAKARRSVDAIKRILVPTHGMPYSDRGVELACRLGAEQNAEIVLTYILEVPRTLPLGAELPKEEEKANEALARAEAIVNLHGLRAVAKLDRAREAAEEIIRSAKEYDVDIIVMGVRPRVNPAQTVIGKTTDILLRRAPCEVIIDRPRLEK
ncbi:MAG: universal stress protein [bacterium]|nr:universal stress protein [bacterium]